MSVDIGELIRDANWLPHRLLDEGRNLRFLHVDREAHRSSTFLDELYLGTDRAFVDVPIIEIPLLPASTSAPVHFIFHSAFARSTLLARAMDWPGCSMGLKEPAILNDAASLFRARLLPPRTLDIVLRLLARAYGPGEAVIVKPSNVANALMREMLARSPGAQGLLLYRALPAYLRSIARKGMFGRIWARKLLHMIRQDAPFDTGFSDADLFVQTDLQAAALGWLVQHAQFAALAKAMPDRVRTLDADRIVADRRSTYEAILSWFGLGMDIDAIEQMLAGPVFSEDSKRLGSRFNEGDRAESPVDDEEIAMVVNWTRAVADHVGLPLSLNRTL